VPRTSDEYRTGGVPKRAYDNGVIEWAAKTRRILCHGRPGMESDANLASVNDLTEAFGYKMTKVRQSDVRLRW
jgi:hypothetical protein